MKIEPVVLTGTRVSLEPLAREHADAVRAAASDGELWKLWYTSVPRPDHVVSAEDLRTLVVDWEKVADAVEPFTDWVKEFLGK